MADQRREPSKPETEPAQKTSDSVEQLTTEELRAISGGHGIVISEPKAPPNNPKPIPPG